MVHSVQRSQRLKYEECQRKGVNCWRVQGRKINSKRQKHFIKIDRNICHLCYKALNHISCGKVQKKIVGRNFFFSHLFIQGSFRGSLCFAGTPWSHSHTYAHLHLEAAQYNHRLMQILLFHLPHLNLSSEYYCRTKAKALLQWPRFNIGLWSNIEYKTGFSFTNIAISQELSRVLHAITSLYDTILFTCLHLSYLSDLALCLTQWWKIFPV